ncbi:aspartyl-phosphate phosphatase Spo0E family protein [Natranaerobius trueperi]|uniref:Aspartyl-phosphate phosphatase Spo0E family protein n=1 Tax=Natranaerobius trueperi TaxID=759412 RepID=A0A226BUU2_9FIRM|nr:aspartyl-phosphate phosphatase Spo0E family protein [Natranaerobius trueperi]OWZ82745.1 hypothetical protein CDO51_12385 [Natranaerobius trueperi]
MDSEKLDKKIDKLREELTDLIEQKGDFNDDEVIEKSEELDTALNEYTKYLTDKDNFR